MMRRLAAFLCAATMFAAAPAWAACLQAGHEETAEGWLKSARFKDANGRPEDAYILHLDNAACLAGNEAFDKVDHARTIHVFSTKDAVSKRIRRFVDKAVRVRGTPFGTHTAHHHAPIVMDITEIAAR
jgi:hypothetical protein